MKYAPAASRGENHEIYIVERPSSARAIRTKITEGNPSELSRSLRLAAQPLPGSVVLRLGGRHQCPIKGVWYLVVTISWTPFEDYTRA